MTYLPPASIVVASDGTAVEPAGPAAVIPSIGEHDHAVLDRRGARAVDHGAAGDGDGLGRGGRGERGGEKRGGA